VRCILGGGAGAGAFRGEAGAGVGSNVGRVESLSGVMAVSQPQCMVHMPVKILTVAVHTVEKYYPGINSAWYLGTYV
jgi:hypothetical protein